MYSLEQKNVWIYEEDYPSTLSGIEMSNPLDIIYMFYRTWSLPQAKLYLWQAVKYNLTDISTPSKELRPKYHRFLIEIERLVDAAWIVYMTHSKKAIGTNRFSKDYLKSIQNDDFISFLSTTELSNPNAAIRDFFEFDSLCDWKKCFLEKIRKAIVNPSYDLFFSCNTLTEFVRFSKLSKLLEGLFLLLDQYGYHLDHSEHNVGKNWFTGVLPEVIIEKIEHFKSDDLHVNLQHFANICYAHRFHHEWNGYNTYRVFESYENVLEVTHTVIHLLNKPSSKNKRENIQKIRRLFNNWSPGRITRFVSKLLLTSRTFEWGYKEYISPQKEIDELTRLIYLAHEIY